MKVLSILTGRKQLSLLILLLLTFSLLGALNVNVPSVSAVDSPYIAVVPDSTADPNLAPGNNFTVSIYTDYTGDDIWMYEFNLTYNPFILQVVSVTNGDLIATAKHASARFLPGSFNNTAGTLSLTLGYFFFIIPPPYTTSGPGILANVTFTVIGFGSSDITLGSGTKLIAPDDVIIIDGGANPDQLGHGYFDNTGGPEVHDVHVVEVVVSNETHTNVNETIAGGNVTISVEVRNEGTVDESVNVTVSYDGTLIDFNDIVLVLTGNRSIVSFSWKTPAVIVNTIYTVKAEVPPVPAEVDTTDNNATMQIKLVALHDVSVEEGVEAPSTAFVGQLVSINVTVTNQGSFDENVTLTLKYTANVTENIGTKNFILKALTNNTFSFSWNTTGLVPSPGYRITTEASIEATEDDLGDNAEYVWITLVLGHDVSANIFSVFPSTVDAGELVTIWLELKNLGGYNETFYVEVTYDSTLIRNQTISILLVGSLTSFSFYWDTTNVPPASYNITAEAILILDEDANPDNNLDTYSIVVNPPPGTIVGTVTDALTGDPIPEANVTVTPGDYSDTTDAYGHYYITDVLAGNYTVTASATGYESASQTNIIVYAEETTTVNFTLRVNSTITISADPATITVGESTTISGSISPIRTGVNVTIQYRLSGEQPWNNLTTVTTNESGQYSHVWTPETAGTYEFKAKWLGDENTLPAESNKQTITVKEAPSTDVSWELLVLIAAAAVITIVTAVFYFFKIRKRK